MNELGNWISQGTQKPFYVRKEFDVKKEIVKLQIMSWIQDGQIMTRRFNM